MQLFPTRIARNHQLSSEHFSWEILLPSHFSYCQHARERGARSLRQGTFSIVETVVPSREVTRAGEQLCVLLGFRTTEDNCVDTAEADSERCQEARSWRDWTGIGTLYQV